MAPHRKSRFLFLALVLTAFWMVTVPAGAQQAPSLTPSSPGPSSQGAPAQPAAPATPQSKVDSGDTAWMLTSAALVLMMTAPGLALFYGGMVRRHNVLGTIMQSFILMAVISIQWILWGYSVAFGPDISHLFGSLDWIGLKGVGLEPFADYAATIPHQAFMVYQLMFAIITPGLIAGAFAERMKFSAMLVFTALWSVLVYDPLAHMVWGQGGFLNAALGGRFPTLDFAGGTVVHISSGVSALVCALYLGKRVGYPKQPMTPHSVTLSFVGACLLWVGWFGFNAGSALSAGSLASSAFIATHFATAAAVIGWAGAEWLRNGKPSVLGGISGAVAGLVAITPASGFVTPMSALIIGLTAGVVCYLMVAVAKNAFGYDDSLDAFGVHGVGGTLGALLTGIFATRAVNPLLTDAQGQPMPMGLLEGNAGQMGNQLAGVLLSWAVAIVGSLILLKVTDLLVGLRVTEEQEIQGLDLSQHGEVGYDFES
jgi:Amt family ammonium transporter